MASPPPHPTRPRAAPLLAGVVKMRRGEVARIMFHLSDFADVCVLFRNHAGALGEAAQVGTTCRRRVLLRVHLNALSWRQRPPLAPACRLRANRRP